MVAAPVTTKLFSFYFKKNLQFQYMPHVYVFLCMVLLAVRMVADVTETRNVIKS